MNRRVVMLLTNDFVADPRVEKEACALIDAGWDVTVLAWDRSQAAPTREERHGIRVERLGPKGVYGGGVRSLPQYQRFWSAAAARAKEIDPAVVHCHDMDTVPAGLQIVEGTDRRLVIDFHELYRSSRMLPTGPIGDAMRVGVDHVESRGLSRADLVIVAAPAMLPRYQSRYDGHVISVENAPDLERFTVATPDPDGPFRVCYIGQKRYLDQLTLLVDIAAADERISALLAGGGVAEHELARYAEGKPRVEILGRVRYEEIADLYKTCSCVWSLYDASVENASIALPVKALEGMAAGLPLVVAEDTWIAELVAREGVGVVVDPGDPEGVRRQIEQLVEDPKLAAEMGARGRALVETRLNWEISSRKLVEGYSTLLSPAIHRAAEAPRHEAEAVAAAGSASVSVTSERPRTVVMFLTNDFVADPRVEKEARALMACGWDVTVIAWDRSGAAPPIENRDGIRIERFGPRAPYGGGPRSLPLYNRWWDAAADRARAIDPRVVHCHDMDTVPAGLAAVRDSDRRLVLDFHELYRASRVVPGTPVVGEAVRFSIDQVESRGLGRASLVVLAWPGMQDRYTKRFDGPVVVVDNAPDLERFSPDPEPRGDRPFRVSYIGQKRYLASLKLLVDIVERHEDMSALLAGGGVAEQELAEYAAGKPRLEIVGRVKYDEIPQLYRGCDCVYTLYDKAVGNARIHMPVKVMEAMACGLPSLVTAGTWVGEYVERERLGFAVDADDAAQVEAALVRLAHDPELAHEMGLRGRAIVEDTLNWQAAAKRLTDAYERLA